MQKVNDFLKQCKTFYLATVDGDQPRVRPFGAVNIFEGKLYIATGKVKPVSKQMMANPKIEISAFDGQRWIRLEAVAKEDDRIEARQSMLDAYPALQNMYKADDGNAQVFYLADATATFYAHGGEPEVIKF